LEAVNLEAVAHQAVGAIATALLLTEAMAAPHAVQAAAVVAEEIDLQPPMVLWHLQNAGNKKNPCRRKGKTIVSCHLIRMHNISDYFYTRY
jgi:hypothetical protein